VGFSQMTKEISTPFFLDSSLRGAFYIILRALWMSQIMKEAIDEYGCACRSWPSQIGASDRLAGALNHPVTSSRISNEGNIILADNTQPFGTHSSTYLRELHIYLMTTST
jgi:hypothetical protein